MEQSLKILILSPHRGDAAFSLAIAMHNWLMARHTVTLLNVFTRSRHAPYSDAAFVHENDELSYVSAMRLREDELFLRRIVQDLPKGSKNNLRMADLNLKDAPIRLRCAPDSACSTPMDPADPAIEKIRKALVRHAELGAIEALVVPAALGDDVDHLTIREAAEPFTSGRPTAFYEDLPYAATHPSAPAGLEDLRVAGHEGALRPVLCQEDASSERKRTLVLGYASQIDAETWALISSFARRYDEGERLWADSAWCEIAEANRLSIPWRG